MKKLFTNIIRNSCNYKEGLKLIILDWAGTTLDYGCYAPAVVFRKVFENKGVPITIEEARGPMGAHKKVHISKICEIESVKKRWIEVHNREPNEKDVNEMFEEFVPLQENCLMDYIDLIPRTLETIEIFRNDFNLKIGSTTGYLINMTEILKNGAKQQGYDPDSSVCAEEVIQGRPAPWMCLRNARNLNIWPMQACIKVDDTIPGIQEGLNAGMWSIGVAKTGNEIGLNEKEINELDKNVLQEKLKVVYSDMYESGAHYVVDQLSDVPEVIIDINNRLSNGERP